MRHTDTYVHFEGVRFVQQGNWCDPDPETGRPATTERRIADHTGREFIVRTAGTCTYATEPVPQGTGSVYGIIDYFNGIFSPETDEINTDGTPSGRWDFISSISPSSSMSHLVMASSRCLSSSSGLYCVSSPSKTA